jgi:23S rRNA (pseudouridine1915-N3)-methyltransferase
MLHESKFRLNFTANPRAASTEVQIRIVAFGKLKTPGLREALDYYLRNLRPWAGAVEELELKPLPVPDKSPASRKQIQEKEGALLLEKLKPSLESRGVLVLLDETGKALRTQEWADQIKSWESEGVREVSFCIGSSLGFSSDVRGRARKTFSLGPQTLPHELARVVLGEQLYRAYSLLNGHPYHNEGT